MQAKTKQKPAGAILGGVLVLKDNYIRPTSYKVYLL